MAGWLVAIRGRVPWLASILLGLVPIAILGGLWWWLTAGEPEERHVGRTILPSPQEVFSPSESIVPLFKDRGLVKHVLISLRRVGLGFLLAVAISLPAGVLMGAFGSLRATFAPIVTASGYIPIATLVPLTMSWFGIDEKQKIAFLAIAFTIFLLPSIIKAMDNVPDVYLRTASTLGASRPQLVLRVMLPVALPDIWHSMRLAFGVGWTYLVLTETVVLAGGLGDLIYTSQRRNIPAHIYLAIVVITLIAWAADLLWANAGRLLFPYRRSAR